MSAASKSEYESYVARTYRRDGLRLSGVVEVAFNGTTHRFTGTGDLLAIMRMPSERIETRKGTRARGIMRTGRSGGGK